MKQIPTQPKITFKYEELKHIKFVRYFVNEREVDTDMITKEDPDYDKVVGVVEFKGKFYWELG